MRLNYSNLTIFNKLLYSDLLTYDNLIKELKIFDAHCLLFVKDKKKYLVANRNVNLPIKILGEIVKEDYREIYHIVTSAQPVKPMSKKIYTFRQLVDEITSSIHNSPDEFKVYGIIALASLIQPLYIRVATESNFGKSSLFMILRLLTKNVSIITPKTLARIEYELGNQIVVLNELRNLRTEQIKEVEQFLANVCDRTPEYSKSTRASSTYGTKDIYSTFGKSFIVLYNLYSGGDEKYFDSMFHNNVLDKVMPLKFNGTLELSQFNNATVLEVEAIKEYYLDLIRSIEYYKHNWKEEVNNYEMPKLHLKGRHNLTFNILMKFVDMYCKSQSEFTNYLQLLLKAYNEYYTMLNPAQQLVLSTSFPAVKMAEGVSMGGSPLPFKLTDDDLIEFVREKGEYGEMDFIEKYGEEKLEKLLRQGDVYILPNRKIKVLE